MALPASSVGVQVPEADAEPAGENVSLGMLSETP